MNNIFAYPTLVLCPKQYISRKGKKTRVKQEEEADTRTILKE